MNCKVCPGWEHLVVDPIQHYNCGALYVLCCGLCLEGSTAVSVRFVRVVYWTLAGKAGLFQGHITPHLHCAEAYIILSQEQRKSGMLS